MKLDVIRWFGVGAFLVGAVLLWFTWENIFLDAGERDWAAGDALATSLGIFLPGLFAMLFGERLANLFYDKRKRKGDMAIVGVGIGLAVAALILLNWVALIGHWPLAEPEAETEAEAPAVYVPRAPVNVLEEAEEQRREAELTLRQRVEGVGGEEATGANKPPAR